MDLNSTTHTWMNALHDKTLLQKMWLPGTYNSCNYRSLSPGSREGIPIKSQDCNIEEQLNFGIRYLDVRITMHEGQIWTSHDKYLQKQPLSDVLQVCGTFLKANPSESIVFCLKPDASVSHRRFIRQLLKSGLFKPYSGSLGSIRGSMLGILRLKNKDIKSYAECYDQESWYGEEKEPNSNSENFEMWLVPDWDKHTTNGIGKTYAISLKNGLEYLSLSMSNCTFMVQDKWNYALGSPHRFHSIDACERDKLGHIGQFLFKRGNSMDFRLNHCSLSTFGGVTTTQEASEQIKREVCQSICEGFHPIWPQALIFDHCQTDTGKSLIQAIITLNLKNS